MNIARIVCFAAFCLLAGQADAQTPASKPVEPSTATALSMETVTRTSPGAEKGLLKDTRVFISDGNCPAVTLPGNKTYLAAVGAEAIAAIASTVIDKSFDLLAAALAKAGDPSVAKKEAVSGGEFYKFTEGRFEANPKCVVLITAAFGKEDIPPASVKGSIFNGEVGKKLHAQFGVATKPEFYFEGLFEYSTDRTAFRIVPITLVYDKHLDWSLYTAKRDLVIGLSFAKSSSAAGSNFATVILPPFIDIEPGTSYSIGALWGGASPYVPVLPLSDSTKAIATGTSANKVALDAAKEDAESYGNPARDSIPALIKEVRRLQAIIDNKPAKDEKPDEDKKNLREAQTRLEKARKDALVAKLGGETPRISTGYEPFNVMATITETRNGSKFLKDVAAIVSAASSTAKPFVQTAVQQAIDPSAQQKAENAAQDSSEARHLAALNADQDVLVAQQAYASLPVDASAGDRSTALKALNAAKSKANSAWRAWNGTTPYVLSN